MSHERGQVEGVGVKTDRMVSLVLVLIMLIMAGVLGRVVYLQVGLGVPGGRRVMATTEPGLRGPVVDRRGRTIAVTRFAKRVIVDPLRFAEPPDEAIVKLAEAMGIGADEVGGRIVPKLMLNQERKVLKAAGSKSKPLIRYVPVGGVLDDDRVEAVASAGIKGVFLERVSVREYPAEGLADSIVGKVGFEQRGMGGVELAYEGELVAADGSARFVTDARGRALWTEPGSWVPARHGERVRLSIDLELQRIAIEELKRGIEEADAVAGRLMMMDPETGEVLAMVDLVRDVPGLEEYPWEDFEAGKRGDARLTEPMGKDRPRYRTVEPDAMREIHPSLGHNRCVEDVYEPGSTFKVIVWSAVTELGKATPDEMIDTEGGRWRTPYGRYIEDVTKRPEMTWSQVLTNSSNIGMVKVTSRLSFDELRNAVLSFGFGAPVGTGLAGEASGLVTSQKRWSKYSQTSVAFGDEVAVTMPQMLRAFCAFAREGDRAGTLPPVLLTAVDESLGESRIIQRVVSPEVARLVRAPMHEVMERVEKAMKRRDPSEAGWRYELFGKSGTPEIPVSNAPKGKRRPRGWSGYFEGQYRPNYIAAGPMEAPKLVCLVVVDDPGHEFISQRRHYGSGTAGPIVRRVMERSLAYMGVGATARDQSLVSVEAGRGD